MKNYFNNLNWQRLLQLELLDEVSGSVAAECSTVLSGWSLYCVCHDIGWKCTGLSVEVNTKLCELPVDTRET